MLAQGIIKKAPTQFINPLVITKKKNGKLRMCLDARRINSRMEADHDKPANIKEILNEIDEAVWYAQIDIYKAFWTVELTEESKQFNGFLFDNESYIYNRLPFGLKTSGGSFYRGLTHILGVRLSRRVKKYLDDLLAFAKTWDKLMK